MPTIWNADEHRRRGDRSKGKRSTPPGRPLAWSDFLEEALNRMIDLAHSEDHAVARRARRFLLKRLLLGSAEMRRRSTKQRKRRP